MTAVLEPLVDEVVRVNDVRPTVADFSVAVDVEHVAETGFVRTITGRGLRVMALESGRVEAIFGNVATSLRASADHLRASADHLLRNTRRFNLHLGEVTIYADRILSEDEVDEFHAEAVDRGVEFLDRKLGRDVWLPRVNLETLDVATGNDCALAQATGVDYSRALRRLNADHCSTRYGFSTPHSYQRLTRTWIRKIKELRAAGDSVRITA
jgi:hypothetical protein